ncbi:putative N-acyl homoserine lactone transcriptional regulator, LuxR-like [Bradyrhizobium sp. STM 3843]|uniref:LuxR family transcriptional regulator n=1 Tax=unclassified Bradyrhizobium TaxID=2631580 RepID=UPI0002403AD6|nr:LuxR family transcriptional regulator [Bradyrhizobium sp. STM 3843]CCE11516.1 putative N-acyl homoserine lactone transcriptional regulator, LuxR-like [Bradyrhizobium sp. STM 3843]
MDGTDAYWGRRALDFVDALESSTTSASVITQFERLIGEIGFRSYIIAGIPTSTQSLDQLMLANGWPAGWFEFYTRENLHMADPIPRHCLGTLNPFMWSEAPYDRERDRSAHEVMMRARDFGLQEGFCIPIHYDDAVGAISLAGERPHLDTESKSAVHLISIFTYGRLRALGRSSPTKQGRRLSEIEAEVLRWAARGKTAWETAQILGLSERNVRWHLEEAQRKLMTNNKTATVATALVNGEILL